MKPNQTLSEAHNYLVYIADALFNTSRSFSMDKQDRISLEKYAEDILAYSKGLEKLMKNMEVKEQMKKKEIDEQEEQMTKRK